MLMERFFSDNQQKIYAVNEQWQIVWSMKLGPSWTIRRFDYYYSFPILYKNKLIIEAMMEIYMCWSNQPAD